MIDKNLMKLLGKNKKYIYFSVASMIICFAANITITAFICRIIALSLAYTEISGYIFPLIGLFCAIVVRYIGTRVSGGLKDTIGREVKKSLREKIYGKTIRLGLRSADGLNMAGLTQVSIEGVEQLDLYFSSYIPQFFYAMMCPFLLFFVCVGISWKYAVLLICCVPLIPVSIIAVSKYAKKIFAKYWGKYTSMGDAFLDSVQGMKELKIFKADGRQHKRMNEKSEEFRKITMKVLVMQLASTTIMDLVAYGGAGGGIAIAVWSAWHGLESAKALFLVLVAVEFSLPLRAFGSAFHVAMNGLSAGKKIIELLDSPDPEWGNKPFESAEIELKNVSFSYNESRGVIDDISIQIGKTGMTALAGESGCGTSTLAGLITGALRCTDGIISVGKTRIEELDRNSYYDNICVVTSGTYIFNVSVRENFRLINKDVTDEEIYQSLRKVNMYDFISENGGLDKIINEDAENISGGQKQRLALAIRLIKPVKLYIFDEATSNIDVESEKIIMENIRSLSKNSSVIVISHRLENVVSADKIYYMKNGEITESGSHEELMRLDKGYASLYSTQRSLEKGYTEVLA